MEKIISWFKTNVTTDIRDDSFILICNTNDDNTVTFTTNTPKELPILSETELLNTLQSNVYKSEYVKDNGIVQLRRLALRIEEKTKRGMGNAFVRLDDGYMMFYAGRIFCKENGRCQGGDLPFICIGEDEFMVATTNERPFTDYFIHIVGNPDEIEQDLYEIFVAHEEDNTYD